MTNLLQDLRYALRTLRRTPGFNTVAVLCLALGIGAVSTVFGLVDVLFFRPPAGVGAPEAVVRPYITRTEGVFRNDGESRSIFRDYTDLRDHTRTLAGLAAYTDISLSVDQGPDAGQVDGQMTSGNYFAVLGVRPALGRFFTAEEDEGPGAPPAVVIGYDFWQKHFGGDPAVLGRLVRLDGYDYPVVGVAPAGFQGIDGGSPEVWIPFAQAAQVGYRAPYAGLANMVGRLAPGVTREQAEQELGGILRDVAIATLPDWDQNPRLELAWPGTDPLGRCVDFRTASGSTCHTVVGIAANSRYLTLDEPERAAYFIPVAQEPGGRGPVASLVIRTAGYPSSLIPTIRLALAELDPALPYISLRTMEDFLRPQLQPRRLGAAIFSAFGLIALVLSAVGLYGVISYAVAQRTHEMGVRIALGAGPRELQGLVVGQGVKLTLAGLALGLAAALAGTRLIMHHLFGVSPVDPATFAGVVLVLAGVAVLASWVPARRAARVDPMVALRAE